MANLANAIKDEVTRLARKEVRAQVAPLKTLLSRQRKQIVDLRRQIQVLSKVKPLKPNPAEGIASSSEGDSTPRRFVPKGLVSLRARLALTVADLAFLLDVSPQSIANWQSGKTRPRDAQIAKLVALRHVGKKEVRALLAASRSSR